MTEAITQCPGCQTAFKVTEAQLLIADGSVRCGFCLHIFKAKHFFVSPLLDKTERLGTVAEHWSDLDDYVLAETVYREPEPSASFEISLDDDHDFLMQDRRRLFTAKSLKWLPGITLMIAVAIGQFAFFRMGVYAQMTEYRPTYVLVCRYLGCEVPEYENHDELSTRELVIRSHPKEPGALLADVLLLNSGPFRQAFPGLRLQFYDVNGNVVASRVFRASDYLGGEMRGLKLMPAATVVRLSLELIDPGNDALDYQMDVVRL